MNQKSTFLHRLTAGVAFIPIGIFLIVLVSCLSNRQGSVGPGITENPFPHEVGNVESGKTVYRFETFGNEGFWTDAARLPEGMLQAKLTPLDALKAGLSIDAEALSPEMRETLLAELKTDLSPKNAPRLNDVRTTVMLIEANAVIGIVPKDSNGDGAISLAKGDKVGVSCTLCHAITDKSVYDLAEGGSIGRRIDGPAALTLNMGKLLATMANSRAVYPNLQLELGGKTIGRAPKGLTENSTEAEVDAYLSNPEFYPVGTFDETQDGHGNPVANVPLFRQDLAAPYGTAGEFHRLEDIGNASYTTNLDPTSIVTPEGRQFMQMKGGAGGVELADDYAKILHETGVKGHPFVAATVGHKVGDLTSPVGRKVDRQKLLDMNAYMDSLPAPKGAMVDESSAKRGENVFRQDCTACHNVDQSVFVPPMLIEMARIYPGYQPVILAQRDPPLSPIQNSEGGFDDKMIVVDASDRGDIRGNAMPMLLDLARKKVFLHDMSVHGLHSLLDPKRGTMAPHPFYVSDAAQRDDVVNFLRGLDTER